MLYGNTIKIREKWKRFQNKDFQLLMKKTRCDVVFKLILSYTCTFEIFDFL